ncbi:ribose/galactose isomerase [Clostridium sp. CAG:793]|nr:ribose/galactose isomerase [Clostridium sp. CAG:793]
MKIGLINENSQAGKNKIIYNELVKNAKGNEIFNYSNENTKLTYVQVGLLAAILLNSKAVDFVITGCGTGEGAMLALNSFPGVLCGHVQDPLDAYLFTQINNGNAIAIPFAKGYGWGGELQLDYIFEKLFSEEFGNGYPKERVVPEQKNKKILDEVKKITYKPMKEILDEIDQALLLETINTPEFKIQFFENAQDEELKNIIANKLK